jgi:putative ABC transport system ATP-binding protein
VPGLSTEMAAYALSLHSVSKSVSGGRVLFGELNLQVAAGEFIAIMGESGVGKSTLLNIIAGLDQADGGSVSIDGTDLASLNDDARTLLRRDRIGFVFQAFHILPHLTLAQNIALPLVLQHVPAQESMARAQALLDGVGLGGRSNDYPRTLSGGELQRVAIARALIHRPGLILADEPTGNLDPETAARIMELFVAQVRQSRAAVLLVTHSKIAAAAADRVLRLTTDGIVEQDG